MAWWFGPAIYFGMMFIDRATTECTDDGRRYCKRWEESNTCGIYTFTTWHDDIVDVFNLSASYSTKVSKPQLYGLRNKQFSSLALGCVYQCVPFWRMLRRYVIKPTIVGTSPQRRECRLWPPTTEIHLDACISRKPPLSIGGIKNIFWSNDHTAHKSSLVSTQRCSISFFFWLFRSGPVQADTKTCKHMWGSRCLNIWKNFKYFCPFIFRFNIESDSIKL